MARVFVDTNVLFPFSVMDLMLALTEDGVHDVMWSQALLAEWERVIVRTQRRSAASAAAICRRGVRVCTPDDYLCGLLDAWPDEILGTVTRMAGEKRRPPLTPADLADSMSKAGVPAFAQRLQAMPADRRS